MFYPNDRIGLFIDGANFHSSARSLGLTIDYDRLRKEFAKLGHLTTAVYATALLDDGSHDPVIRLADWLSYNGWRVLSKPAKVLGEGRIKGNMDLELALEMIKATSHLQHIVLFSGDGDFRCIVQHLQENGTRVTVISTLSHTADELRRQADEFVDLETIGQLFTRSAEPASLDHFLERTPAA